MSELSEINSDICAWDERIDHALGRAAAVLESADRFVTDVEEAAGLASNWRYLADAWMRRQRHAANINDVLADLLEDDEDDDRTGHDADVPS